MAEQQCEEVKILKALHGGDPWGSELLEALGLKGKRVVGITINIPVRGVVEFTVKMLVHSDNLDVDKLSNYLIETAKGPTLEED